MDTNDTHCQKCQVPKIAGNLTADFADKNRYAQIRNNARGFTAKGAKERKGDQGQGSFRLTGEGQ
jgi:hypothetical protein